MLWNWQRKDWPRFRYDKGAIAPLEAKLLQGSGLLFGAFRHLDKDEKEQLTIQLIATEAEETSKIEGEMLNRDSLQSSIRKQLGLQTSKGNIPLAEQGIGEMMVDLYKNFDRPLSHTLLFNWHNMLMRGNHRIGDVGRYRTHSDPMQVVSGYAGKQKVHFEAPPAKVLEKEMDAFIDWFKESGPRGKMPLPSLTRAGIAHLYFVSIHPFEDGNGRIARALSEKALSEVLGHPTLIAFSRSIEKHRKSYYTALQSASKDNEITSWLIYFANTVLDAQNATEGWIEFIINKAKLYERLKGRLNYRQENALAKIFAAGPCGFAEGISAEKYIKLANTSRATATRDLQELVELGVFKRTGELKGTRYWLNMPTRHAKTDTI